MNQSPKSAPSSTSQLAIVATDIPKDNSQSPGAFRVATQLSVRGTQIRGSVTVLPGTPGHPEEATLAAPSTVPTPDLYTPLFNPPNRRNRPHLNRQELNDLLTKPLNCRWDETTRSWITKNTAKALLLYGGSAEASAGSSYSSGSCNSEEGRGINSGNPAYEFGDDDAGIELAKRRKRDRVRELFRRVIKERKGLIDDGNGNEKNGKSRENSRKHEQYRLSK